MKLLRYFYIIGLALSISSCNEDALIETPLDFYSPENSYTTEIDIESALTHCYLEIRVANNGGISAAYNHFGTDLAFNPDFKSYYLGDYTQLTPQSGTVINFWATYYKMIFYTNTIIDRIDKIEYLNEADKKSDIAEAKFFRAYAYRCLVHLYGDIPIVVTETTSAKYDYVRESKETVFAFIIEDLTESAANLPDVGDESADGKLNKAAAQHLLSEIYIAAGDNAKAIAAATAVIDNPEIELMTTRFGAESDNVDGDPYWDLFQIDNQNRSSGNKEGIFIIQIDASTVGGGAEADMVYGNAAALSYERNYAPATWLIMTPDGHRITPQPSSYEGGRGVSNLEPTNYLKYDIWRDRGNWDIDARNNERNIKRDFLVRNSASEWDGKLVSEFPQDYHDNLSNRDTTKLYFPYFTKLTTLGGHPDFLMIDPDSDEKLMTSSAGLTYHDWYLMRVAETYLLRAEAYLLAGNAEAAAADINKVRARSGATLISAGDVTLDYILDERARELGYEEPRRLTLQRMGKLVERTRMYNPVSGLTIEEHNEIYPIPYSEVEVNTGAKLEQNDGYVN